MAGGQDIFPMVYGAFFEGTKAKLAPDYEAARLNGQMESAFKVAVDCLAGHFTADRSAKARPEAFAAECLERQSRHYLDNLEVEKDLFQLAVDGNTKELFATLEQYYGAMLLEEAGMNTADEEFILNALYAAASSLTETVNKKAPPSGKKHLHDGLPCFVYCFVRKEVKKHQALFDEMKMACKSRDPYAQLYEKEYQKIFVELIKKAAPGHEEQFVKEGFENKLNELCRSREKHPDDYDGIKALSERKANARLNQLYEKWWERFAGVLGKQFSSVVKNNSKTGLEDLYQVALTILIQEHIDTKRLRVFQEWALGLTSSLGSFLTGIGRNKILESIRKWKGFPIEELDPNLDHIPEDFDILREVKIKLINESLEELDEPRRLILELYYFKGLSHQEIAREMGLRSAGVSRVLLYRARNNLREIVMAKLPQADIEELSASEDSLYAYFGLNDSREPKPPGEESRSSNRNQAGEEE